MQLTNNHPQFDRIFSPFTAGYIVRLAILSACLVPLAFGGEALRETSKSKAVLQISAQVVVALPSPSTPAFQSVSNDAVQYEFPALSTMEVNRAMLIVPMPAQPLHGTGTSKFAVLKRTTIVEH